MLVGYARVSTVDQDTDMQLQALRRAGVRRVFAEQSSSVGARPELQRLLCTVRPGQRVVVYKLDRLARSLKDLLSILDRLERAGAGFQSLTEPIDTQTPAGRLMLQVLGSVAEFERSLIRERVVSGQVAALRRGVRFGVPKKYPLAVRERVFVRYLMGERIADLARDVGCSTATVHRFIQEETGEGRRSLPVLGPLLGISK